MFDINQQALTEAQELHIGIDNGLKGAIVALNEKAFPVAWWDTPTINMGKGKSEKYEFLPKEMAGVLRFLVQKGPSQVKAWLEVAHAMQKQGLASTFKTGRGFGLWEGIVSGLAIPYDIVRATTWQKAVLKDVPKGDPKQRSILKCQRVFPQIILTCPKSARIISDMPL